MAKNEFSRKIGDFENALYDFDVFIPMNSIQQPKIHQTHGAVSKHPISHVNLISDKRALTKKPRVMSKFRAWRWIQRPKIHRKITFERLSYGL